MRLKRHINEANYPGQDKDVTATQTKLVELIKVVRKFPAGIRTDASSKLAKAIMKGSPSWVKKVQESLDFVKGFITSVRE